MASFNLAAITLATTLLGVSAATAEEIQIQLRGNVPKTFEATLIWEEANTARCAAPCQIASQRVKIRRNADGIGVVNVDQIPPATRLCFNGYNGNLILDTVLYLKNGKRAVTNRQDGNVESNGRSGCSSPQARMANATVWLVNLE